MITDDELRALLEVGSRAPSYHNIQPWRCRYGHGRIEIALDPERSAHLMGMSFRPSLLALGAFVENVEVAAAARGFQTAVTLAEEISLHEPMAIVEVKGSREPSEADAERLLAALARETNRRAPEPATLAAERIDALVQAVRSVDGFRLFATSDEDEKESLAQLLSGGATLALYNPRLHDELLRYNRWTPEEAELTRDGIDAATLEVDEESVAWLKRMAPYEVFASETDPDAVFAGALPALTGSSHLGILLGPRGAGARSALDAGRAMGRMWNQAAAEEIALQPWGVLLLYDLEDRDELEAICDAEELEQTDDFLEALQHITGAPPEERAWFAFRAFAAERASTRSLRREVEDFARPFGSG